MKIVGDLNSQIVHFWLLKKKNWSYALVAEHFKVSRNVVAGAVFRYRHPPATRVESPKSHSPNKIGTGFAPRSYQPRHTYQNTRI